MERFDDGDDPPDDDELNHNLKWSLIPVAGLILSATVYIILNTPSQDGKFSDVSASENKPRPHSVYASIPEGKAFPAGAEVQFRHGRAVYTPSDTTANINGIVAECGGLIDTDDLFVTIGIRGTDDIDLTQVAVLPSAPACADGKLTEADRLLL